MYELYFGLKEAPFSIAPNPRFLFMGEQYQEALAHLGYGMRGEGGIIVLTGEVGTGKTTICRQLLEEIPEQVKIAYIINPRLSVLELLATICDELGIKYPARSKSIKTFTDLINQFLLKAHAEGLQTVLMIDEAQNLAPDVLEQLRLLTNLETSERKLLQIILLGQPELNDLLQRQDLRQLTQRITARFHLHALNRSETKNYIRHRLQVAGCDTPPFSSAACRAVFHQSDGIPRMINLICDRSLLGAYAKERKYVDPNIVRQAAAEITGKRVRSQLGSWLAPTAATAAIALAFTLYFSGASQHELKAESAATAAPEISNMIVETVETPIELSPAPALEDIPEQIDLATITEPPLPEPLPVNITWPEFGGGNIEQQWAVTYLQQLWDEQASPLQPYTDACEAVRQHGFQCITMNNGFSGLRSMGIPAMITLLDGKDRLRHAVLFSLNGEQASLSINGEMLELSLDELSLRWFGEYTLLWKEPAGYTGPLRPGVATPAVGWLAEQLDKVQGTMVPAREFTHVNPILIERVRQYQQNAGLKADGTAGPQTLLRLAIDAGFISKSLSGEAG